MSIAGKIAVQNQMLAFFQET